MNLRNRLGRLWLTLIATLATALVAGLQAGEKEAYGIDHRIPWTTSRLTGSPDPSLPYTVERTFAKIKLERPLFMIAEPQSDRLFVIEHGGESNKPSRILAWRNDPKTDHADLFLAVTNRMVLSFTFHPSYRTNGYIYVFSNGPTSETNRLNRISRYTVGRRAPYPCNENSELTIIEWRSMGHDGGGIVFGSDGMLYISSGDGSTDSDDWVTGQDLSELNGGILRIDVDHHDGGKMYSVPRDNPFIALKNARPENWAYGLRNPWRLTADPQTGQIWTGNNGQDLWETTYLVRRGENYGWSVYEGSHPFYLNRRLGPTPVTLPTTEHDHSEARSVTGGVVYRGKDLPELDGFFIYGDFSTGKIWGTRHDGNRVGPVREIANTEIQITAFAVDQQEHLLIVDYLGSIYRLVRSPAAGSVTEFPKRLSETGLFASTSNHQVQPGVISYSVNAPAWNDGALGERFVALPADMSFEYNPSNSWNATNGGVLVQTLSLEREVGHLASRQRIETRILLKHAGQWSGYSYRWNETQSDAGLIGAKGDTQELTIKDRRSPGGIRTQIWRYPSRAECSACHSRAANFLLGLTDLQLNKVHDYGGVKANQLRTLQHIGLITNSLPKPQLSRLADPYDKNLDLEARARSYLHVNCSVCHVATGGGNSKMQLIFGAQRAEMKVIGERPQHDTFGIADAMLIAPGDPNRSILYQRLARRGRGQMPPVVIASIDEQALALFRDWIGGMKPEQSFVRDWTMEDLLPWLEQSRVGRSFESGQAAFKQVGCGQCHKFAGEGGSVGPDLSAVGRRLALRDLFESMVLPSKVITEGYARTEIEKKSGEILVGRVLREDNDALWLDPQAAGEQATSLHKADIRRREWSKVSNMPAGILNTLKTNQILDLVAYLVADGNSNHVAFVNKPTGSGQRGAK